MKFTTAVISALCASVTLAAPTEEVRQARREQSRRVRHENRLARRDQKIRSSKPKIESLFSPNTSAADVSYSTNWSGAVLISSGFTGATGTANVPSATGGSDAAGSAWVGIDGWSCGNILQTGFDFYGDGTYDAWYEWYPYDYAGYYSGITISKGDSIKMTVVATSKTAGTATLQNLTTGKTVSHSYSVPSTYALCESNAEWIIEDFEECNSSGTSCEQVPLAKFSTITFTGASATKSGSTVTPSGATVIDMVTESGDIVTACSLSGSTVTCAYE